MEHLIKNLLQETTNLSLHQDATPSVRRYLLSSAQTLNECLLETKAQQEKAHKEAKRAEKQQAKLNHPALRWLHNNGHNLPLGRPAFTKHGHSQLSDAQLELFVTEFVRKNESGLWDRLSQETIDRADPINLAHDLLILPRSYGATIELQTANGLAFELFIEIIFSCLGSDESEEDILYKRSRWIPSMIQDTEPTTVVEFKETDHDALDPDSVASDLSGIRKFDA